MKNNRTIAELKRIAEENGGILKPEIVVEEARPRTSPLHSRFCWDDTKAAHAYRIWQARQLIRVVVEVIDGIKGRHEVFVSLSTDRKEAGYRIVTEVLSDSELRQQMLIDAMQEMVLFRKKYERLKELSLVFIAINRTASKLKKKKKK